MHRSNYSTAAVVVALPATVSVALAQTAVQEQRIGVQPEKRVTLTLRDAVRHCLLTMRSGWRSRIGQRWTTDH